jgi:hypothetical protein
MRSECQVSAWQPRGGGRVPVFTTNLKTDCVLKGEYTLKEVNFQEVSAVLSFDCERRLVNVEGRDPL